MLIYRILNNNAVISKDEKNKEIIVTGKGVAFRKSMYEEIDEGTILKIFVPKDNQERSKLETIISEIPYEFFAIAEYIKQMAEESLDILLEDGLSIRLADHIHYSIQKIKKNIVTPNLMLNEIRHFYGKEYEVGLRAISYINQLLNTSFDEHEAGFIAFHIVSSEGEGGLSNVNEVLERLQAFVDLIEKEYHVILNTESNDYARLITHLKFFINKMCIGTKQNKQSLKGDSLYDMLLEKYTDINAFLNRVNAITILNYNYELSDEDRMYLIIHLARLKK